MVNLVSFSHDHRIAEAGLFGLAATTENKSWAVAIWTVCFLVDGLQRLTHLASRKVQVGLDGGVPPCRE